MQNNKPKKISLAGQTLIETLAALFILVMGVTAATSLAIYSFSASTSITKQIIATGLAREGMEAVKNMRDTNWLKQSPIDTNCYNFSSGATDAKCYKQWLNVNPNGFNIATTSPKVALRLGIDANKAANQQILWANKTDNSAWGLNFDNGSAMNLASFYGFYNTGPNNDGITDGSSGFYRQILLTEDNSGNYSRDEFHRLIVESRVWWTEKKKCPKNPNWPGLGKCSVSLVTHLTNWKDYQLLQ